MVKVFVCSKSEARKVTKKVGATHLVSLLDPGDHLFRGPRLQALPYLYLPCADVLSTQFADAPTRDQVAALLDFTKDLTRDDVLVVHCFAGVSRSTAAAFAVLCQHQRDPEIARALLVTQRPKAQPNTVISKYADDLLGFNGELLRVAEDIANNRMLMYLGDENGVDFASNRVEIFELIRRGRQDL